jgi:spectinomycin phosphotransferase
MRFRFDNVFAFKLMIQAPDIPDDMLLGILRDAFGVDAACVEFLPLGNDTRSFVYRVAVRDGVNLFLKLRAGAPYPPSLGVPRRLRDAGITPVVAPLPAHDGTMYAMLGDFTVLLYPYISGDSAMTRGMTSAQWRTHGRTLRQVHGTALPGALAAQLPVESWRPASLDALRDIHARALTATFDNVLRREAQAYWTARRGAIEHACAQAAAQGALARGRQLPYVLCHADIHTANIMIADSDGDGAATIHYVDWDGPMFAPKERDLKFVLGTDSGDPVTPGQEAAFLEGYGETTVDHAALAYYRTEWIVEDFAAYGDSIFFFDDWSEAMRADAFDGLRAMFAPGGCVEMALRG